MKLGDHVRRLKGDPFIGIVTKVFQREVDKEGVKCAPFAMMCAQDAGGSIILGSEADFKLLGS